MAAFVLGVAALFVVAAIALLRRGPTGPRGADQEDPNLRWYEQRRRELGDDEELLDEARLRLLEDGGVAGQTEPEATGELSRLPAIGLLLAVFVASVMIYTRTGAVEDVLIYRQLSALSPDDDEGSRRALLARIEARSEARTDNLQYLGLLGRLYMAEQDYRNASAAFDRLVEEAPEDPQALALAAQARFLAAERSLDSDSQLLAEKALAVNPNQRTALGLLGMASFEAGVYSAAISYWERLQSLEQPGSSSFQMLEEVLAMARARQGSSVAQGSEDPGSAPGVSVTLSLPAGARSEPGAVLFVFARPAASSGGMPLAARRLSADALPLTLRLSDNDSMAGGLLSTAGDVVVSAQLSRNGQPGVANAVFSGSSAPVAAGGEEARVEIELEAVPSAG